MADIFLLQDGVWTDGADQNGAPNPGETITYTFTLQNVGIDLLTNVSVIGPEIDIDFTNFSGELASGEEVELTGEYTIQQDDVDRGQVEIIASVTGTEPGGIPFSVAALPNFVSLDQLTALNITKVPAGFRDQNVIGKRDVNDEAIYNYTITNSGNINLFDLTLADDNGIPGGPLTNIPLQGLVDLDGDNQVDDLAPGATATGQLLTPLTQDFLTAGIVENIATTTGRTLLNRTVENVATAQIDVRDPRITVDKVVEAIDLSENNPTIRDAGDLVTYRYTVTNTGNVPLFDVRAIDDNGTRFDPTDDFPVDGLVGLEDLDGDGVIDDLAVGQSATGTELVMLSQAVADAGFVRNNVLAQGISADLEFRGQIRPGKTVNDTDNALVVIPANPAIALDKTAGDVVEAGGRPDILGDAGDTVTYRYDVTNTGNVTLQNVVVADDNGTPIDQTDDFSLAVGTLQPGESATVQSNPIPLTQLDVDNGSVTNIAIATGEPPRGTPVTAEDDATVELDLPGQITLTKTAGAIVDANNNAIIGDAGDTVTYRYAIANDGPVTLTLNSLQDDNGTPDIPTDDFSVLLPTTVLAPGETLTVESLPIAFTQAKVDLGTVTNTAIVTATDPQDTVLTATDTATVEVSLEPSIILTKTGVLNDPDQDGFQSPGETVDYTYVATNNGPVTLFNVNLRDDNGTPNIATDDFAVSFIAGLADLDQDGEVDDLAVGATAIGTYTKTLTEADLASPTFTNIGTVTAVDAKANPARATDPETVMFERPMPRDPAIQFKKTAVLDIGHDGCLNEGDIITYTFTIQNTGNVNIDQLQVQDDLPGISRFDLSGFQLLAPDQSFSFTATYAITLEDIHHHGVSNFATVYGNPEGGNVDDVTDDVMATAGVRVSFNGDDWVTNSITAIAPSPSTTTSGLSTTTVTQDASRISQSVIYGTAADDVILPTDRLDYLVYANDGRNFVVTGAGADAIYGGNGFDLIIAGDGNNTVYANEGRNLVIAGDGNDTVYGGSAVDWILTGAGDDLIYANEGDNFVAAGAGENTVYLGHGADYVLLSTGGMSKIFNFNAAQDKLILNGLNPDVITLESVNTDGYFTVVKNAGTEIAKLDGVNLDVTDVQFDTLDNAGRAAIGLLPNEFPAATVREPLLSTGVPSQVLSGLLA
ncbi:hypothetical protein IQ266_26115 [filamentous cyanobacterium LEGE 11480]|uniref:DUF7507 domain-containing protein n=1 Tax=Romeriopsis navalis LEGE 11480 TaxID=2777977 RepID=A0A928Z7J0_9CYAN|nr:hypothetical protein [Romeriopsis navalis]MBE9033215.1 hypothetical protein [Romeriopsis navalis LEGE 11480]